MIYDRTVEHLLIDPERTGELPVVEVPGVDDELVERTDNSLRPDDLELPQPPQDRGWRP